MKLSFIENILLKGALKKSIFWSIIIIASEIICLALFILGLYIFIKAKKDEAFNIAIFWAGVALIVFLITTYQNIIRKIYKP